MEIAEPTRRAVIGALVGTITAVIAVTVPAMLGQSDPYLMLTALAVALVGLELGAGASLYCYLAIGLVLGLAPLVPDERLAVAVADPVRFATFLIGSPLVVLLVYRAEREKGRAREAHDASAAAERATESARAAAESAGRDLDVALQKAERERARLEEVAEAIPEPLIVYDPELRGTYGNRAALRLFGRSFFEQPIADWARVADPRDERGTALPQDQWPQVLAQSGPVKRRMTVRLPMSGRDIIVDVEGTPIPGGGCVLLLRDVGKEEDERRRLSRFASFVAHELRNPLAVAKARTELALRDQTLPTRPGNHARRALESVDAAIAILERLELYSRADTGSIEVHHEEFDVADALRAAVEQLRARGSEREVELSVPPRVTAVGDRQLAQQAIANLLTNAERYSTPGETIRVTVTASDPVTLRVIDAGPGISDQVAERLFRDRVTAGRGLGLGLYLVQATMSAQGGSVQLEQRRPQAVFALRWPRDQVAASSSNGP